MDTLAIVISVLALVVSAVTSYYQFARQPRLSVIQGENLALSYDPEGRLVFVLGVTITNAGAKLGIVLRLDGRLESPDSAGEPFAWHSFAESSDAGPLETAFSPIATVNAWVHTLVVPGMGAVVKRVVFRTSEAFKVPAGELTISMDADEGSSVSHGSGRYFLTVNDVHAIDARTPSADDLYRFWFVKRTPRLPARGAP